MLRLLQIYKMVENKDLFIDCFNNLDFELNMLGYNICPELLMSELLLEHFGLEFTDDKQLKDFTKDILKKQNNLSFLKTFN